MPLKVLNPYDQSVVAEVLYEEWEAVEKKLSAAREAFGVWKRLPVENRAKQVREGLRRFRADAEEIAKEVTLQMGKPIVQARREVETFFDRAEHMLSIANRSLAPEILPSEKGMHLRIEHAPLGVVLNIAAWNYPLIIPANVVVPALLAGDTVLLKHSERTPLCGDRFERAFGHLDPPNLVTRLTITHETAARLIADRRVDYVAFTGSVRGGLAVYGQAARRVVDVGLELGGKDPAYVAEDADLELTVENVIDGACYNAGQSCCAVERVYVHRRRYEEFLERSKILLERYRMGSPMEEGTTLGPLAIRTSLDFLESQVNDALRRGAKLLLGGKRLGNAAGNFFPPTLLAAVPNDAEVMQEESFGPIVPVLAVSDDDEALRLMQQTRYGLTASIWTSDRERAERFAREVDAGTIYQNRCDYLDPGLPWTGARDSGIGSTLSRYGFYHLTRRKGIHFRESPQ
jgi:acyl-CoA reductase-like NAD-dependent aldehyde dehydrogenase